MLHQAIQFQVGNDKALAYMTMISEGQVFFSVNEKAVKTCKSLPHEELEGKNTNPNLDVKQKKKKKLNITKTGNCGTSKNVE